ncbi:hypothetical protein DERF_001061 [Dermatophagoides farinae]|uniref:Uncharacterized protein n=1 Tax=Dermatophagoides farinae TaxID=6954 RepID=A0A922IE83_DERFA|nr:hypothetical protein DERF_001061 [Dermatophagoides farinae]
MDQIGIEMEMKQVVETSNSWFSSIEIKIEKNEQNSIVHDKFSLIITQSQPSNNNNNNDDDDNEWKN